MYSVELKIKRQSLGAEIRLIRQEERRQKAKRRADSRESLYLHRVQKVRPAARAAHLAHMFLRGRAYALAENPETTRTAPDSHAIADNLRRFGGAQFEGMTKANGSLSCPLARAVRDWIEGGAPVGVEASTPKTEGLTPSAPANV